MDALRLVGFWTVMACGLASLVLAAVRIAEWSRGIPGSRDRFLGSLAMSAGAGLYIVARLEQPLAPPIARLLALVLGATMVLVGLKLARRGKQVLRESQARQ